MTSPGDFRDDAAAYALGALDADARRAFEVQLAGDPTGQEAVDAYREVAALLAFAAPPAAPPNADALRARVMAAARGARTPALPPAASEQAGARAHSEVVRLVPRERRFAAAPWWAAAASLVIAVASGWGYVSVSSERERLARTLAQTREDFERTRLVLADRDSVLAAFMGPMVHVVSLSPDPAAQPNARVFWNHTKKTFIVTAFNVPRAPAGKTYQLWAIRNGKPPLSMGTFDIDASGRALAVVPVGVIADAGRIDSCAMTLEPAGGSPQPTETPRLMGSWRHVD